ncbi:hypothetical protein Tco_0612845 [Tanacetum coccineum]|uniref:Uncharacterized protein n=1 Tax=Tanacetum coccineum TaxID=301880 RepID=A0ABQ5DNQ0_9ASTR
MVGFATNDQANYYSRITSIMVNGKNAYELKGKLLDDLHNNAFSGTYKEVAVERIEYFQKIIDPIDLPNRKDGYYNGGNLPRAYIVGNTLRYQDLEWYDALKDSKLKKEALKNKDIMEGIIEDNDESCDDGWKRCEVFNDHEHPVYNIRIFKMIKYSFGQDKVYVAMKEDEYEDLTSTSEDECQAYQEIFRMLDEGWMITREELRRKH